MTDHDVFICHATADKQAVVELIVAACRTRQVSCWYDKTNLKWGDDLAGTIASGVQRSRFVLVVASENAAGKGWPLREISQAIELEVRKKQTVVLPLFVGARERLLEKFPQLGGKLGKQWENNPDEVADEIVRLLGRGHTETSTGVATQAKNSNHAQPKPFFPQLKKSYTDQDRNKFLKDSFRAITDYFETAARQYSAQEQRVSCEVERLDIKKFALVLYLDGAQKHLCQLWIDNSLGRDSAINYFAGPNSFNEYNARNEMLGVVETQDGLKLKGNIGDFRGKRIEASSAAQAAEILWCRFMEWFVV
jgi:hypothetical protein